MKILAIDPGLAILGWSVITTQSSGRHDVLFGAIETAAGLPLTKRLHQVYEDLQILYIMLE